MVTQVYNQQIASDAKLSLMEALPDEYPITYIHKLGMPDESIREIPLYELDRQPDIDYLTSLYIKPYPGKREFDLQPLQEIIYTLLDPGGGCGSRRGGKAGAPSSSCLWPGAGY